MSQNQELAEMLKQFRENIVHHIELIQLKAQLCREYYLELLEQSFTKQEALELCKHFKPE